MSKIKTNSIETLNQNFLNIDSKTSISSPEDSSSPSTGSLILEGGIGINKNLYIDGSININSTVNSTEKNMGSLIIKGGVGVEKNIYLGGELISENFLNITKTSQNISFFETSNTSVTGDFTNSNIIFLSLNGSSTARNITISVQNPTINKMREIQFIIKSNGNYSFNSTTLQGSPILWKTSSNASGTQPTWSQFNTLTDSHSFLFDGARLFHVNTFSYFTPTILAPTNLNYQTNTFDIYPYVNYIIPPSISTGTPPFSFSNPTNDLQSGIKLNTFTGDLEIYRTQTLNTITPTIRIANSSGFSDRQVNIRISHGIGTITKGISGNSAGYEQSILGSISNNNFYSNDITTIKKLRWNYINSGAQSGYWFYFELNGNMTSINWNTLTIDSTSFLKSEAYNNVNGVYNEVNNITSWEWWSTYNNGMNLTKYNSLQNYTNPISFRIF